MAPPSTVSSKHGWREALARGGVARVRVGGASMGATAPQGGEVLVRRRRPSVGDVVLIDGEPPLLHRLVVAVSLPTGRRWVHVGDAPGSRPGLCRDDAVVGVAELPRRAVPHPSRLLLAALGSAGLRRLGLGGEGTREIPDWRSTAARYDAAGDTTSTFADRPATRARFARLDAALAAPCASARRVLELGCGDGRLLARLGGQRRIGVDISSVSLGRARRRGLVVLRADAHQLPFPEGSFDAVVAGNAVFRYLDYRRAFAECHRVLAPGGRLALHQYVAPPLGPREALHLRRLDELVGPATDAGFVIEELRRYRNLRWPPYLLPLPSLVPLGLAHHVTLVLRRPAD